MGTIGIGISYTLDYSELAGIEELFEAGHLLVQTDFGVELQNFLLLQTNSWTRTMVEIVGKGYHRVESIIAAGHLQDDKNRRVASSGYLCCAVRGFRLKGRECICQKAGNGPGESAAQ